MYIMPRFAKGSKEAKEYMASIRGKKGKGLVRNAIDDIEKLGTTIKDQSLSKTYSDAKKLYADNKDDVMDTVKKIRGKGKTADDFKDIGKNIKAGFQKMGGGRIHNRKTRPAQGGDMASALMSGLAGAIAHKAMDTASKAPSYALNYAQQHPDQVMSLASHLTGSGLRINNQYVPQPPSRLPSVPQGEMTLGLGGRSGIGGEGMMCPNCCGSGLTGFGMYAGAPMSGGMAYPNTDKYGENKMCCFKSSICGAKKNYPAGRPKGAKNRPKGGNVGKDILSGLQTGIKTVGPLLPLLAML